MVYCGGSSIGGGGRETTGPGLDADFSGARVCEALRTRPGESATVNVSDRLLIRAIYGNEVSYRLLWCRGGGFKGSGTYKRPRRQQMVMHSFVALLRGNLLDCWRERRGARRERLDALVGEGR